MNAERIASRICNPHMLRTNVRTYERTSYLTLVLYLTLSLTNYRSLPFHKTLTKRACANLTMGGKFSDE